MFNNKDNTTESNESYSLIKKAIDTPDLIYDTNDYHKVMKSLNTIKADLDVYFPTVRNYILRYSTSNKISRKDFAKNMSFLKKSLDILKPII